MPKRATSPIPLDSSAPAVGDVDHDPPPSERPFTVVATGGSERLWHEVHERLTAFVAQRVDDPADVADLVQTVFLRVHQHMASIEDEQRLLPWLFQITRNAIADYYRAPVRRREIGGVAPDGAVDLGAGQGTTAAAGTSGANAEPLHPIDPRSTSDDAPATRELAGCVRPLLQLLPPSYQEALTLVEFDGVAQVDAASRLGISVSGMKSRVQRGRALLRDGLLECCEISRSATGGVLDFAPRSSGSCGTAASEPSPKTPCGGGVVQLRCARSARPSSDT